MAVAVPRARFPMEKILMLPAARHQSIVDAVQRERVVRVSDLAQQLGVSPMTVRRDIEIL